MQVGGGEHADRCMTIGQSEAMGCSAKRKVASQWRRCRNS